MSKTIFILNGPNLNLLGKRQPEIYGHETLDDVEKRCAKAAGSHGLKLRFLQSNREYEIIDWIHEARDQAAAMNFQSIGHGAQNLSPRHPAPRIPVRLCMGGGSEGRC